MKDKMGDRYYSNNPADRAKDTLNHYFKLLFDKVGLHYNSDIQSELDDIVDNIIEASKQQLKEELPELIEDNARLKSHYKALEE
jgi:hypothetical protein